MNVLATIVACYGLFGNSTAVVIGAMIIAMLLGPIGGVALALVDGDDKLLAKALGAELGGVLVVMVTAFVIGRLHMEIPITEEILSRTEPNFLDLMVALGGGAAGAYAIVTPRLSVVFVGVAIATALVPPLASCSILLARGEYKLALGAFLLAFTNIVAIQFASSMVMWASGMRSARGPRSATMVLLRNGVTILLLAGLAVLMVVNLRTVVAGMLFQSGVREVLHHQIDGQSGAHVADVRFSAHGTVVRAVVRGPDPMSADEVGRIERLLPASPGRAPPSLRVHFVRAEIITAHGVDFAPGYDDDRE
jgi:uncharacterized hydrophobic protein (TIGR00271 family)